MLGSMHLSAEIEARLTVFSTATASSEKYLLREAIERGLEDVDDYYLAVEVMERVRRGEEKILTSEEFRGGMKD